MPQTTLNQPTNQPIRPKETRCYVYVNGYQKERKASNLHLISWCVRSIFTHASAQHPREFIPQTITPACPPSYALRPRIPPIQRQPTPCTTDLAQRTLTVHIAIGARSIPAHAGQRIAHPALAGILDASPRILALLRLRQTRLDAHAVAR